MPLYGGENVSALINEKGFLLLVVVVESVG
jgi:hypothetical protein